MCHVRCSHDVCSGTSKCVMYSVHMMCAVEPLNVDSLNVDSLNVTPWNKDTSTNITLFLGPKQLT